MGEVIQKESAAQERIPDEQRQGLSGPLFAMLGMNVAVSTLMVGGGLIEKLTLKESIFVIIIGILILVTIFYIQGLIGMREGLTTYKLTEMAFGKYANKFLVSGAMCISLFGWFGIQTSLAALSIQKIFPQFSNYKLIVIIVGVLMTIFAAKGFHSIKWVNYILIPPILILVVWGLIKTSNTYGLANIWSYVPKEHMGIMSGLNMVVGLIMCGAIISSDYTRFCKKKKSHIAIISIIGIGGISAIQETGTAIIAMTAPSYNIVDVLFNLGFNWVAFVILIGAAWSTNLTGAYSGGLALNNIFPKQKRSTLTFVAGMIGTVLAMLNVIQYFQSFLNLISVIYGPIAGILWVEYYLIHKKEYVVESNFNVAGIVCCVIGAVTCYITSFVVVVGVSAVNGLVMAGATYYGYRVWAKGKERVTEQEHNDQKSHS